MAKDHCGDKESMADHVLAIKAFVSWNCFKLLVTFHWLKVSGMVSPNDKNQRSTVLPSGPMPDGGLDTFVNIAKECPVSFLRMNSNEPSSFKLSHMSLFKNRIL